MTQSQDKAIRLIEAQRKGLENTAPWMVGEQLKDICLRDPGNAELIAQDLEVPAMSLASAEKRIKGWADKQKRTGNCVCVPPNVAEEILRSFYGLKPAQNEARAAVAGSAGANGADPSSGADQGRVALDFDSFL